MGLRGCLLGTLMLVSAPALALGPESGYVDAFYVPYSTFEATFRVPAPFTGSEVQTEGHGIGIRGMLPVWGPLVAFGEYQDITIDDSVDGIRSVRAGAGVVGASTSGVYFLFESFEIDDDFRFDGAALVGRAAADITDRFKAYGELGYAALRRTDDNVGADKDYSGLEFSLGAAWQLNYRLGFFGDYRVTSFSWTEAGTNLQFDLSDLRIGGRFQFGG